MVFQLISWIIVTLNMFCKENSNIGLKIKRNWPCQFRAYFSLSFGARISFGPPLQTVGTPFQKFIKEVPTVCKGGPNDISAPKDEEKYVLKLCMGSFPIF